jgi:phthalate 4,5-cis-dihydrodiol dehydrogenase
MTAHDSPIRLGVAGLGTAGRMLIAALQSFSGIRLMAVADPTEDLCRGVADNSGVTGCSDLETMCARDDVDAIYIATPTSLHAQHVTVAARAGKHILVEKPMAVGLAEADVMVEEAARAGVILVVGHSQSFDPPVQRMRDVIESGSLGKVRMINNLSYTDWLYRPRRADELDLAQGGGATLRQGAHQVDIIRYVGGGMLRSVRAQTFAWDSRRPTIGAHSAYLEFEDGTAAMAVYNGYGAFLSAELSEGVGPTGALISPDAAGRARASFGVRDPAAEMAAKRARTDSLLSQGAGFQPFFGLTIVSCEGGDIRQSREGLFIYDERGRQEVVFPTTADARHPVLQEFRDAIRGTVRPAHDGQWGLANLEVCLAIMHSAQSQSEVRLRRQVSLRR